MMSRLCWARRSHRGRRHGPRTPLDCRAPGRPASDLPKRSLAEGVFRAGLTVAPTSPLMPPVVPEPGRVCWEPLAAGRAGLVGHGGGLALDVSGTSSNPNGRSSAASTWRTTNWLATSRSCGPTRAAGSDHHPPVPSFPALLTLLTCSSPAGRESRRRGMSDTFQDAPGARLDVRAGGAPLRVAVVGAGRWWGRQRARIFAGVGHGAGRDRRPRSRSRTAARAREVGARRYIDARGRCSPPDARTSFTVSLPSARTTRSPCGWSRRRPAAHREATHLRPRGRRTTCLRRSKSPESVRGPRLQPSVRATRPACRRGDRRRSHRRGDLRDVALRRGGGNRRHPDGNLIETQCHGFDMLEHLAGPIASVAAEGFHGRTGRGHFIRCDRNSFRQRCRGQPAWGAMTARMPIGETHRVEINGTAGRILIVDTVRQMFIAPGCRQRDRTGVGGGLLQRPRSSLPPHAGSTRRRGAGRSAHGRSPSNSDLRRPTGAPAGA